MTGVDYEHLVRRLVIPPGRQVPRELVFDDLRAEALTRHHLADDVAGINASIELIRRTRGGPWPNEPVTEDFDYVDLVWHECEFREGDSFTYALMEGGSYLGCAYLYPLGRRTRLTPELLAHDVDVSWWVTPDGYERGRYTKAYAALRHWLATDLPFFAPYFSNVEIPPAPDGR